MPTTSATSPLPILTVDEIRQGILDSFTVYLPNDSTEDGSDAWVEANALAIQLNRLQLRDAEIAAWISVLYAKDEKLDALAMQWLPVGSWRKGATKWIGRIKLTKTSGTPTILIGQVGTCSNGASYKTTEQVDPGDWDPSSNAYVAAESITTGTTANQNHDSTLTLSSPPVGVAPTARLWDPEPSTAVLAEDQESDDDLRRRILNATRNRPASGNWAHYVEWVESVDGVDEAYVYPRMYGLSTVLVVPLGPGRLHVVTDAIKGAVLARIGEEGKKPSGCNPTVLKATAHPVSIAATVTPKSGYGPDWSAPPGTPTTGFGSTVNKIVFGADVRSWFGSTTLAAAGKRIVVPITVGGVRQSAQGTIATIDETSGLWVTLEDDLAAAPAAAELVRPGGPLWQPIYDAVAAIFDDLGPARCIDAEGGQSTDSPRWPSWLGNRPAKLFVSDVVGAIEDVIGVAGVAVTAPAADHDCTVVERATTVEILTLDPEIIITWSLT